MNAPLPGQGPLCEPCPRVHSAPLMLAEAGTCSAVRIVFNADDAGYACERDAGIVGGLTLVVVSMTLMGLSLLCFAVFLRVQWRSVTCGVVRSVSLLVGGSSAATAAVTALLV